jgi:hypothetical protein
MASLPADREARLALFQKWFSDTIPHSKALGLKVIDARRGFASMQLEWREELVGNPETGVRRRAPALLDGAAACRWRPLGNPPFATLDCASTMKVTCQAKP